MGPVLTATAAPAASLAAQVDGVLDEAGLRLPTGHSASDGYTVEPMTQCGPARVAVRWHHAGPRWPHPGHWTGCAELDLCRAALTTAGYRVEIVHAAVGPYLAVLPRHAAGTR